MNHRHSLMMLIWILLCVVSALVFYWTFIDGELIRKVIIIENPSELKTEKDVYIPGEMVRAYISYCKYRNIPAVYQSALVNHTLTLYSSQERNSGIMGCKKDVLIDLEVIPPNSYADTFHINRTLKYRVNPLREVIIQLKTVDFKVVK